MATLESVLYSPQRCEVLDDGVRWVRIPGRRAVPCLPQVVWSNNTSWREANLWALHQATDNRKNIKTVRSALASIHAYAKWLEREEVKWFDFPAREADRCLVRYRGALIEAMKSGEIAPSTASQRMAAVVRLYRWLAQTHLLSPEWPMWRERQVGIRITDSFGFERTLQMRSTDLAIPNRARPGERLEDGLLPVSTIARDQILGFAETAASEELRLMLRLGFCSGLRIGTITDLRIGTLERATPDPLMPGWFRLAVGPGAHPPVSTKFGVTGQVWIVASELQRLRDYFFSPRRLLRQAKARPEDRDVIFLTRFGHTYGTGAETPSNAVNVEMGRLRKSAAAAGLKSLHRFHFHQTRATFATELARVVLRHGGVSLAIQIVKEALLHKDEAVTLKYIRFVEKSTAMEQAADAFTKDFLGLIPAEGVK